MMMRMRSLAVVLLVMFLVMFFMKQALSLQTNAMPRLSTRSSITLWTGVPFISLFSLCSKRAFHSNRPKTSLFSNDSPRASWTPFTLNSTRSTFSLASNLSTRSLRSSWSLWPCFSTRSWFTAQSNVPNISLWPHLSNITSWSCPPSFSDLSSLSSLSTRSLHSNIPSRASHTS